MAIQFQSLIFVRWFKFLIRIRTHNPNETKIFHESGVLGPLCRERAFRNSTYKETMKNIDKGYLAVEFFQSALQFGYSHLDDKKLSTSYGLRHFRSKENDPHDRWLSRPSTYYRNGTDASSTSFPKCNSFDLFRNVINDKVKSPFQKNTHTKLKSPKCIFSSLKVNNRSILTRCASLDDFNKKKRIHTTIIFNHIQYWNRPVIFIGFKIIWEYFKSAWFSLINNLFKVWTNVALQQFIMHYRGLNKWKKNTIIQVTY